MTDNVTAAELAQFVERIESINADIAECKDYSKEVYAELHGRGYCKKTVRKIVALRKKSRDQLAEEEAIEQLYRDALGL